MIKLFLKKVWEDVKGSLFFNYFIFLFCAMMFIFVCGALTLLYIEITPKNTLSFDELMSVTIITFLFIFLFSYILYHLFEYFSKTWNEAKREEEKKHYREVVSDDENDMENIRKIINSHSLQLAKIRLMLGIKGEDE